MSKKWLWALIPLLIVVVVVVLLWFRGQQEQAFVVPEHIIICLDAGHGGDDPGAVNGERQEKDDNLAMVLAVRDALEAEGHENLEVILTREGDTALELEERADFANDHNATLFVSVHRNSGGGQGVETWVSAESHRHELQLAASIQDKLDKAGIAKDRGVKSGTASNPHASYYVVGHTEMPACLVELGFMDSDTDNALLDEHFQDYAQAIADGILHMVKLK